MKQIWITKTGAPEVLRLQETHDPLPRGGEVRLRVQACGVNFADILERVGLYPDAPSLPFVPGYEVAGVVDMVGQGVPDLREGELVFALTRFGGYSDLVCVPYKQIFKRLSWMNAEEAAAIPLNYLMAYLMLVIMGSLRAGNRVLIHGAAGGVGLAALDICKILGAETYGTASPGKHDFLLARGLNHPLDYRNRDFENALKDLTGGRGVHLILDPFGGKYWPKNYRLLMPTGRLVHFGMSSVLPGKHRSWWQTFRNMIMMPFYTPYQLMKDNKSVAGIHLPHLWGEMELLQAAMKQIVAWYDEALFRPYIDKRFSFEQAVEAHHYLQDRKNIGKILLIP